MMRFLTGDLNVYISFLIFAVSALLLAPTIFIVGGMISEALVSVALIPVIALVTITSVATTIAAVKSIIKPWAWHHRAASLVIFGVMLLFWSRFANQVMGGGDLMTL